MLSVRSVISASHQTLSGQSNQGRRDGEGM